MNAKVARETYICTRRARACRLNTPVKLIEVVDPIGFECTVKAIVVFIVYLFYNELL